MSVLLPLSLKSFCFLILYLSHWYLGNLGAGLNILELFNAIETPSNWMQRIAIRKRVDVFFATVSNWSIYWPIGWLAEIHRTMLRELSALPLNSPCCNSLVLPHLVNRDPTTARLATSSKQRIHPRLSVDACWYSIFHRSDIRGMGDFHTENQTPSFLQGITLVEKREAYKDKVVPPSVTPSNFCTEQARRGLSNAYDFHALPRISRSWYSRHQALAWNVEPPY